jgi:hypothetical protein
MGAQIEGPLMWHIASVRCGAANGPLLRDEEACHGRGRHTRLWIFSAVIGLIVGGKGFPLTTKMCAKYDADPSNAS